VQPLRCRPSFPVPFRSWQSWPALLRRVRRRRTLRWTNGSGDGYYNYQLAYQRGIEAVLWSMPAISDVFFRESLFRDLGMKPGDVLVMSKPLVARDEVLTANNHVNYDCDELIASKMLDATQAQATLSQPPCAARNSE
jgi:hypothetical protein